MNIIAINGGPRENHNTGALLKKVVEGAASKGAKVETINLYKLNYKGCSACFSCKRKGSKSLHNCAVRDDLTPVLEKIKNADAVIFASPIYFYEITGEMRSFLERLLFQYLPYDISVKEGTYFPRELKTAFIYSMGAPEGSFTERLKSTEDFISQIFRTPIKIFSSSSDYPFVDDYTNYETSASTMEPLMNRREEVFPTECEKAFQFGVDFASDENK